MLKDKEGRKKGKGNGEGSESGPVRMVKRHQGTKMSTKKRMYWIETTCFFFAFCF